MSPEPQMSPVQERSDKNLTRPRNRQPHRERMFPVNRPATGTDVSGHAAGMPTHGGKQQAEERKQGVKQPAAPAGAAANAAPSVSAAGQQNAQANAGAKA